MSPEIHDAMTSHEALRRSPSTPTNLTPLSTELETNEASETRTSTGSDRAEEELPRPSRHLASREFLSCREFG